MKYIVVLMCISGYCYATDQIYQYTDANGNWVISNNPSTTKNSTRVQILQEELAKEKEALKDTNELLTQNAKLTKSKEMQRNNEILIDAVKEHQRNIDILNKQLGYLPK